MNKLKRVILKLFRPGIVLLALITIPIAAMLMYARYDAAQRHVPADLEQNLAAIAVCDDGIQSILKNLNEHSDQWGLNYGSKQQFIGQDDRQMLLQAWTRLLECFAQLDYLKETNPAFSFENGDKLITEDFTTFYLAFLIQYRYALEILDLMDRNQALYQILNEGIVEAGVPPKSYADFKMRFLSVTTATKFAILNIVAVDLASTRLVATNQKILAAKKYIYEMQRGRGISLALASSVQQVRDAAFSLWFPIQRGTANLIRGRKIWRYDKDLLSSDDIREIDKVLQPGDIMLRRREWFLTSFSVPGYWTHSIFFIGTPVRRAEMFDDSETRLWVVSQGEESGNFEKLLQKTYPEQYAMSLELSDDGCPKKVMEVLAPGVIFSSLEGSLTCDGLSAVRPRLSRREKAKAIFNSFNYLGRGYDFNFDFRTDSSMVCTEVILKSYEPTKDYPGLKFEMKEIAGRMFISPNDIVQIYDEQKGTPEQQLDFVLFYDGIERLGKAIASSEPAFRESWKRSNLHVFVQDEPIEN